MLRGHAGTWPPEPSPSTGLIRQYELELDFRNSTGWPTALPVSYCQVVQEPPFVASPSSASNIPAKTCHFQLGRAGSYFLAISQHYTSLSPLQEFEEGGDQRDVSVKGVLENIPILESHYMLVYAVSFTHAAWIESSKMKKSRWRNKKEQRCLKVLSFLAEDDRPYPREVGKFPRGVTLDIPERVLDDAVKLIIEPTICSIFVFTKNRKLLKFRFA